MLFRSLKGIITSVEYFDEEKYEGGKRVKKGKKNQSKSPEDKKDSTQSFGQEKNEKAQEVTHSSDKDESTKESKVKRKSEKTDSKSPKKVKTASGTFSVS